MRQVANGKRSRGRPGRNKPMNSRSHTFDSSGPEGKVRGTANQVFEKYLVLARDAQSAGDRIAAENFFQHAEHYFRILNANGQAVRNRPQSNGLDAEDGDGSEGEEQYVARDEQGAPVPREGAAPREGGGERRPETPAELAEAAAGNGESRTEGRTDDRPNGEHRGRGRRPGRRSNGAAPAGDPAGEDHAESGTTSWATDTASAE